MKLVLSILCLVVALCPGRAHAQARHERVQLAPLRAGRQVVGVRITVTLRPSFTYKRAALVLGDPHVNSGLTEYRQFATERHRGYILHREDAIAVPSDGQHTFELRYGSGNTLKSGDVVDLASVWESSEPTNAVHVWGMTRIGVTSEPHTLP